MSEQAVRSRTLIVTAAVASAFLGIAVALVPGLAQPVGSAPIPVSLFGVLAVVLAIVAARRRAGQDRAVAEPSVVESAHVAPRPGEEFDAQVANAAATVRRKVPRQRVRERLRTAAIDVLVATEGVDEATAADMLETGAWTTDPSAASLFADDVEPPLRAVLYGYFADESIFERQVRRAAAALDARLEGP